MPKKNGANAKKVAKSAKTNRPRAQVARVDNRGVASVGVNASGVVRTPATDNTRIESRTEYVGSVTAQTGPGGIGFSVPVQAGTATYSWLKRVARMYEFYRFRSFRVHYRTNCSALSVGTITIGIDYDADDPAPTSRVALSDYAGAASASVRESFHMSMTQPALELGAAKFRTVRSTAYLNSDNELKLFDFGRVYVWISNCSAEDATAGALMGDIYIEYVCEFRVPAIGAVNTQADWFRVANTSMQNGTQFFGPTSVDFNNPRSSGFDMRYTYGTLPVAHLLVGGGKYRLYFFAAGEYYVRQEIRSGSGLDDAAQLFAKLGASVYGKKDFGSAVYNPGQTMELLSSGDSSVALATYQVWEHLIQVTATGGDCWVEYTSDNIVPLTAATLHVMNYPFNQTQFAD